MADYSEFPTTPTAWQEVIPLETEDAAPPARRAIDWVALVPGLVFIAIAISVMTGVELFLFADGGLVWVALIGGGAALLVSELRKVRRTR